MIYRGPNTPFGRGSPAAPGIAITGSAWTPNRSGGNVLATDFPQLPLNTWVTVAGANNKLTDVREAAVYPKGTGTDGWPQIVTAWGGAAWDYDNKRMLISGGGHSDASACENGIYGVDFATMQTTRIVNRDALASALTWNGSALVAGEPWGGGHNYPTATGRPGTSHTYHGLVWIPTATMTALGLGSPVKGGLFYPGNAKVIYNLDTGATSKTWWKRTHFDNSYYTAMVDGNLVFGPYGSFGWHRWDASSSEMTDWQAESYDPTPATPSQGAFLANATNSTVWAYGSKCFVWMKERRECVSIAGNQTAQRMKYGQAIDAATTTWDAYQETITLTSVNGTDHLDFSTANLLDSGTNLLCAAGAHYDHANSCIWIQANTSSSALYKITGVSGTTWTVLKLGTSALTASSNGTYGRFVVASMGGATVGMRISSVDNPIEVIRLI